VRFDTRILSPCRGLGRGYRRGKGDSAATRQMRLLQLDDIRAPSQRSLWEKRLIEELATEMALKWLKE